MNWWVVYALRDPRDEQVRYVGTTENLGEPEEAAFALLHGADKFAEALLGARTESIGHVADSGGVRVRRWRAVYCSTTTVEVGHGGDRCPWST